MRKAKNLDKITGNERKDQAARAILFDPPLHGVQQLMRLNETFISKSKRLCPYDETGPPEIREYSLCRSISHGSLHSWPPSTTCADGGASCLSRNIFEDAVTPFRAYITRRISQRKNSYQDGVSAWKIKTAELDWQKRGDNKQ